MDINKKVAQVISGSNEKVQEAVIEILAGKEITRRTDAVVSAIAELNKMESELKKIKPDVVSYDENEVEVSANWTKGKLEEKKKLTGKIEKLTKALDKALGTGDYCDLLNYSKQSNNATE
jgi:hypothetical protein